MTLSPPCPSCTCPLHIIPDETVWCYCCDECQSVFSASAVTLPAITSTATLDASFGAGTWHQRLALCQAGFDHVRRILDAGNGSATRSMRIGPLRHPPGTPVDDVSKASLARQYWPPR